MPMRAVLFDVGGPIDLEVLHEQGVERGIIDAFAQNGVTVTQAGLHRASEAAVASFASNAYRAMVWSLAGRDRELFDAVWAAFRSHDAERSARRGGIELRGGVPDLLRNLHDQGLRLGLAANQPTRVIPALDELGIGQYFGHREVSGHHGFHKPDVRLFLRACEDLGVAPEECIMVGDRIDNDVVPARLLGMKAVLIRTGRHRNQQPRTPDEVPHAEVHDAAGMAEAIHALLSEE